MERDMTFLEARKIVLENTGGNPYHSISVEFNQQTEKICVVEYRIYTDLFADSDRASTLRDAVRLFLVRCGKGEKPETTVKDIDAQIDISDPIHTRPGRGLAGVLEDIGATSAQVLAENGRELAEALQETISGWDSVGSDEDCEKWLEEQAQRQNYDEAIETRARRDQYEDRGDPSYYEE